MNKKTIPEHNTVSPKINNILPLEFLTNDNPNIRKNNTKDMNKIISEGIVISLWH
jgi:hypothetical protein